MHCYVVVLQPDENNVGVNPSVVREKFEQHYSFAENVWFVASQQSSTCGDIVELLNVRADPTLSCVVVKLNDYNGYATKSLWEKVEQWEKA